MWLMILTMRLIFHINYYQLIHKFQSFAIFCKWFISLYKIIKNQFSNIVQSGGFLGRLLGPLLKSELLLIGNVLKPFANSFSIPLGLTAAASATEAAMQKIFRSSMTPLIIFNEEMNDIIKLVKSIEGSYLLIQGIRETIKNEAKEKKGRFLSMLLGTLGASLLGNLLTGKGTIRAANGTIRAGEGSNSEDQDF